LSRPRRLEDRTDILFVVDDSGSMEDEQQNLAANFDAFIERLAASPARTPTRSR